MFRLICMVCGLWKLTPYTNILGTKEEMVYTLVSMLESRMGMNLGF